MGVYVNNKKIYVVSGAKLNTSITLATGSQHTVVEEWDKCGGATTETVNLTVQAANATTVSISANPTALRREILQLLRECVERDLGDRRRQRQHERHACQPAERCGNADAASTTYTRPRLEPATRQRVNNRRRHWQRLRSARALRRLHGRLVEAHGDCHNATAVTIAGSDNSNYTLANTVEPDRKADVGQHNLHRNGGWRDEYRNGHNECHGDIGPGGNVRSARILRLFRLEFIAIDGHGYECNRAGGDYWKR